MIENCTIDVLSFAASRQMKTAIVRDCRQPVYTLDWTVVESQLKTLVSFKW